MRHCLAPLVPLSLVLLLSACAGLQQAPLATSAEPEAPVAASQPAVAKPVQAPVARAADSARQVPARKITLHHEYKREIQVEPEQPAVVDSILSRGFQLIGTPYKYGGQAVKSGFDCSGFVGYLFKKEAGIQLPRSTRELIALPAPKVGRSELVPGDLLFFNSNGRGRVSHAGIYIGDGQFIHSSSSRSGGVRVDNLSDRYWSKSYLLAKRLIE